MSLSGFDIMTAEALLSMCANLHESCKFSSMQLAKTYKTKPNQDFDTRPVAENITYSPAKCTQRPDDESKVAYRRTNLQLFCYSTHQYLCECF